MKLFSNLLASLALSSSLVGCAVAPSKGAHTTSKPQVVKILPAKQQLDRAAVKAKLAERRVVTVQRFLAYREARVYPIPMNLGEGFHHVWMDENGNLCAAATIISGDWGREKVIAAGAADNGIALANAKSGELMDWILTSGLAHHEIVAIQVPGWEPPREIQQVRAQEVQRLYGIYVDVERQLTGMADKSLELATDALMQRPELARALLAKS